uniref:Putative transposase n=1 Tax=Pyricularia grisea TaxID=148305 RepID=Q9C3Z0_PYRGI|nr:putative transposase [Pyricularia grisea]
MESSNCEARIILALNELRSSKKKSIRKVALIYNVPKSTLHDRINGIASLANRRPGNQKLTEREEEVIVQYILDLDSRGFPAQIADVAAMADHLLAARDARPVGKQWAYRFVQRRTELKTRFSRAYDFQRALCEDPDALNAWFQLVANMRAKYGIQDCDMYNFDETGFMMGQICAGMVVTGSERRGRRKKVQPGNREWATAICCISGDGYDIPPYIIVKGFYHLSNWYTEGGLPDTWRLKPTVNGWTDNETGLDWVQHFDNHTKSRTKGVYRMLVLDGHGSHRSPEFEGYCKNHNIIPLYLPAHSSHLTQPLDVGVFNVLKRAYGQKINDFIRAHITNISKVDFFLAFAAAYKKSMTKENMAGGFRGAGIIPHSPEMVISKLDVRLRTPSPKELDFSSTETWVSQTPHNPTEAVNQSTLVKSRINCHQGSSPTPIFNAVKQLAKGLESIAHRTTLLEAENHSLRKANEALSKRRRAQKTRIREGGSFTIQEGQNLLQSSGADGLIYEKKDENGEGSSAQPATKRRCGNCGKPGHNARTCQEDAEMSDVHISDCIEVN